MKPPPFRGRPPPTERPPLGGFRRRPLLSRSEAEFYALLRRALGRDHAILPKVNLNDLLSCEAPADRWRIAQKHVDFVIAAPEDLEVVVAVELDDPSHEHPVNALHDQAKDHFLGEAGIPVARLWLDDARAWPPEELRRRLLAVAAERVPYPGRAPGLPPWLSRLLLLGGAALVLWILSRLLSE